MLDFDFLRKSYPEFIYNSYSVSQNEGLLIIEYNFEIKGLATFKPRWEFPLGDTCELPLSLVNNIAFSLGMVELVSYWKATCSPIVRVLPHGLDGDMILWWKSLYFGGLGEFFYKNSIKTDRDSFMQIIAEGEVLSPSAPLELSGNLVPIGGGKDSAVTLRILKKQSEQITPYIINSRGATEKTCEAAGQLDSVYRVKRTIDKNLIELNSKGFLNGHTPFSAIVAFSSLMSAIINGRKYVVLSNESSANESTVLGEDVNHQFSKGIEFEKGFISYQREYINSGVEYFSLLRPLSEMQIAALFARYEEYHPIFRSCNVGSKADIWCCNCPKCLFVYIILSPFLSTDKLVGIFGENLLEKSELLKIYEELLGVLPNKPFECVGSRDEVVAASRFAIERMKREGEKLPYLLNYFDSINLKALDMSHFMGFYDADNCLPSDFEKLVISEMKERFNV